LSKLTAVLSRLSAIEFDNLLRPKKPKMRKAIKKVVFDGLTYEEAGNDCGVTKQAIYEQLKGMEEAIE